MAKIVTQTIAINVSKLVKDSSAAALDMVPAELIGQLEQLVGELITGDVLVEALLVE